MNQHIYTDGVTRGCGLQFLRPVQPVSNRLHFVPYEDTPDIRFFGDFSNLKCHSRGPVQGGRANLYEYMFIRTSCDEELMQTFPSSELFFSAEAFSRVVVPQLYTQGTGQLLRWGRASLFYALGDTGEQCCVSVTCDWEGKKTVRLWPCTSYPWNAGHHLFSPSPLCLH